MNCRDTEGLLDRQIDGDLGPEEVQALSMHLAGCETCMRTAARVGAEQRIYARLAATLHDRPSVWPAVRDAIRARAASEPAFFWTWRKAVWIGAPMLATAALLLLFVPVAPPYRPADQSETRAAAGSDTSPRTATLAAQMGYLRAIDTVQKDLFAQLASLPPATAESLKRGLTDLDATIAAARDVWQTNPDDPRATRYLLSAYARKLELLRRYVAAS